MLTKRLLDLLSSVRPNGIEPGAYPAIVEMLINAVILDLTNKDKKDG